ncbi:MAG: uncharacterized protein QOG38_1380 [Hyphomicrobiales bacterium]|jgi:hypothetical protein|nr:uncharacterized protein [Hyphomicrobiales bacterium]
MRDIPGSICAERRWLRRRLIRFVGNVVVSSLLLLSSIAAHAAPADAKARIAFVGDSLAQNYWAGVFRLVATDPCLKSNLDLGRFARPASGLANSVYFNWLREIRRIDDTYKPTVTVISIGLNDRQGILDPKGIPILWGAPNWADKYRQQVTEFLDGAVATKAIVLFVGLPVMRDGYFNTDMAAKNVMYAEAVARLGAPNLRYLEPWKLNVSGPETYSVHAPDRTGRPVQIRHSDGVHFTNGGDDLLALYLLPKIIAALADAGVVVDLCLRTQIAQ